MLIGAFVMGVESKGHVSGDFSHVRPAARCGAAALNRTTK